MGMQLYSSNSVMHTALGGLSWSQALGVSKKYMIGAYDSCYVSFLDMARFPNKSYDSTTPQKELRRSLHAGSVSWGTSNMMWYCSFAPSGLARKLDRLDVVDVHGALLRAIVIVRWIFLKCMYMMPRDVSAPYLELPWSVTECLLPNIPKLLKC